MVVLVSVVKKLSPAQKRRYFMICVVVLLGFSAVVFRNSLGLTNRGSLNSEERDRYLALEFIPKYRINDCVVRFDVHLKATKGQFNVALYNSFDRYISYNEPTIGVIIPMQIGVVSSPETPDIRNIVQYNLLLSNQCDRRFDIFASMVAYAEDLHGDMFSIKRVPVEKPIKSGNIYWIDSPDFAPDYWPTFHKAMRGDGEALLAMVDFHGPQDHHLKHLYLSLAELFLPDGPLKDNVQTRKPKVFKKMFPNQQGQAAQAVERWQQKILKYKSE